MEAASGWQLAAPIENSHAEFPSATVTCVSNDASDGPCCTPSQRIPRRERRDIRSPWSRNKLCRRFRSLLTRITVRVEKSPGLPREEGFEILPAREIFNVGGFRDLERDHEAATEGDTRHHVVGSGGVEFEDL